MSIVAIVISAFVSAFLGELGAALVLGFVVAMGAGAAKQAFDAVVQRDAPDADRGRVFARFEARFQLVWVLGALVPTALPMSIPVGSVVVGVAGAVAAIAAAVNLSQSGPPADRRRRSRRAGSSSPDGGWDPGR